MGRDLTTFDAPRKPSFTAVGGLPRGGLPARMRVLFVTTRQRTGAWLAEALASDSATKVELDEALGMALGVARLREEVFDAVLISHDPPALDALDMTEALRAGGADEPVLILGESPKEEMAAVCHEVGADGFISVADVTVREFLWAMARGVERHSLVRENQRLMHAERARQQAERREAQRLLAEQWRLLGQSSPMQPGEELNRAEQGVLHCGELPPTLPAELGGHYRELLRTYVMMGSGALGEELGALVRLLVSLRISAQQMLQLHLLAVEEVIAGLGSRSARHVLNRANLLVLEVLIQLAEPSFASDRQAGTLAAERTAKSTPIQAAA